MPTLSSKPRLDLPSLSLVRRPPHAPGCVATQVPRQLGSEAIATKEMAIRDDTLHMSRGFHSVSRLITMYCLDTLSYGRSIFALRLFLAGGLAQPW